MQDVAAGCRLLTGLREIAELARRRFPPDAATRTSSSPTSGRADAGRDRGASLRDARPATRPASGAAPQLHGLRRAADLRPRAGRERALPARPDRPRSTSVSTRHGLQRRRHRHPHDRLPERLRAALSRRDRSRRPQSRAATISISAPPSTARASTSSTPRTSTTHGSSRRSSRSSRATRRSAKTASASATSRSARATSSRRRPATRSTPT